MTEFSIKMPKLSTKKVWIGAYGGHYDVIMIFSKKPKLVFDWHDEFKIYPISDPHLIATIYPDYWASWFGPLDQLISGLWRSGNREKSDRSTLNVEKSFRSV